MRPISRSAGNSGCRRARARSRRRRSAAAAVSAPRRGRAHRPSAAARRARRAASSSAAFELARARHRAGRARPVARRASRRARARPWRRRRARFPSSRNARAASPRSPSVARCCSASALISAAHGVELLPRFAFLRGASARSASRAARRVAARVAASASDDEQRDANDQAANSTRLWPVISAGCGRPISASTVGARSRSAPCAQRRLAADVDQRHRPDRVLRVRLRRRRIEHLFEIAVVGGDQHLAAGSRDRRGRAAERDVDRFDRLDRGRRDAGVADHVGVGEVADDEIEVAATRSPRRVCR